MWFEREAYKSDLLIFGCSDLLNMIGFQKDLHALDFDLQTEHSLSRVVLIICKSDFFCKVASV